MLSSKVGDNLRVTLVVAYQEWKAYRRQLKSIIFENFGIDTLVDEVIVLNKPTGTRRQKFLPLDLFDDLDAPRDVLWLLPVEVENADFKDAIRSKLFETHDSTTEYLKSDLTVLPPKHEKLLNHLMLVSHLGFDSDRAVSFVTLAKSIASLFLLG